MTAPRKHLLSAHVALTAVFFFLAAAAGVQVAIREIRSSAIIDRIAEKQDLNSVTNMDVNLNPHLMGVVTSFFLRLTNPHISSAPEAARNQQDVVELIKRLRLEIFASASASIVLIAFAGLFLMKAGGSGTNEALFAQRRLYALLSVSLVFFALGIGLPVLTAVVRGQHMLVGGFIIQTTSKGIVSTVHTLLASGDWLIAILLAGFSIVIPIFKGIAAICASVTRSEKKRMVISRCLETIGKWSLTDVLVAAVLLGCFSLNAIKQENGGILAVPRFGFAFFVIYCVLAARTSYLLKKIGRSTPERATPAAIILTSAVLAAALGAGGLSSYYVFNEFNVGQKAVDLAVVKLVRSHLELAKTAHDIRPGDSWIMPFEIPFLGTLTIDAKVKDEVPLEIYVETDTSDDIGMPGYRAPLPVPGFVETQTKAFAHSGKLPAGKYALVVKNNTRANAPKDEGKVAVHLVLDP